MIKGVVIRLIAVFVFASIALGCGASGQQAFVVGACAAIIIFTISMWTCTSKACAECSLSLYCESNTRRDFVKNCLIFCGFDKEKIESIHKSKLNLSDDYIEIFKTYLTKYKKL